MIAFGCSMSDPQLYARWAGPGIEGAVEPDSEVFAIQAAGALNRSYNLILARAAALPELEALVLVHQDAELADPELCGKVRELMADPEVASQGASARPARAESPGGRAT